MDTKIKEYADNRDIKSLKYIFVDSLDVDPTFVRYEEEYNYCKKIPNLLEQHIELTPFCYDENRWNEEYWTKLKMDLIRNFSDERMMHMREVAKVFLAEKIQRIIAERSLYEGLSKSKSASEIPFLDVGTTIVQTSKKPSVSRAEKERRELEEAKRKLEVENREILAEKQATEKRIEEKRMKRQEIQKKKSESNLSKKAVGIAIVALVVAVILFILLLK